MSFTLYNSKTRAPSALAPRDATVRMYVCGPTVYAPSHLGHARSYLAYDVMKRAFLASGLAVAHVQNFTDVEERIALAAKAAQRDPLAFAESHIEGFFADMDALRILRADHYPRVSQHIPEILGVVDTLVDAEFAYEVDCHPGEKGGKDAFVCDVYFDVQRTPQFGSLAGRTLDDLVVEAPKEKGDREHPMDFALWKSRADWGVTWKSRYGDGRPGWHVECAAMALKYLGSGFDLHGGGLDLIFPHHESEQTIAEAATGKEYCKIYAHNGFVTLSERKMSKSTGNYVTVRELLAKHDAEALRLALVSEHYRATIDFDDALLAEADERLRRWKRAASALPPPTAAARHPARKEFWSALEDDFHVERAVAVLDRAYETSAALKGADAADAHAFFREAASVLGVPFALDGRWSAPGPPVL
ncbi:MAG: cysteine--tRNA ligase [Thermoplasmatota archaeon]